MLLKFGKYILNYPVTIFSSILFVTIFFFYLAFLSDRRLEVDFSLEQMFPTQDSDRDDYDKFKSIYGREDNIMFFTVSNDNVFSDNNLTILELLTYEFQKIDYIDYAFSLGILWDDGDGIIGLDLSSEERLLKIQKSNLYNRLLSKDQKSSLIVIVIDENVYTHNSRKKILNELKYIIDSYKFDLISFDNNEAIFSNSNVLSNYSLGPYSVLESIINDIDRYNKDNNSFNLSIQSMNNCYQEIDAQENSPLDLSLKDINKYCDNPLFINGDLTTTKIVFSSDSLLTLQNQNDIKEIILDNEYVKYSDWEWHEAGIPILRTRYVELVDYERAVFLPIAFVIAAFTLIWIFRQFNILVAALMAILTSLTWVSGIMALFNISINVISYLIFNLLMIIGVSDAIHLLMKYHEEIGKKNNKKDCLENVIQKIGSALFLTSFTTAAGFLSLSITNVKILQEFGIIMAVGIGVLFIVTIVVMPIMLLYFNTPHKKHIDRLILKRKKTFSFKSLQTVQKYPKFIIASSCIVLAISFYGIAKVDSNVTILGDLKPGNKLYNDINFVEDNFGGTLPLDIIISVHGKPFDSDNLDLKNTNSIDNPIFYEKVNIFMNRLINYQSIKSISGYWNIDGDINNQQSKYTNINRTEIRISCGIENIDSKQAQFLKNQISKDYMDIFDNKNGLKITGSTLLALKMNNYLITSLLNSFLIAFFVIFVSMNILFRSLKLSLVSIIPNIIPLLFAGAVMGFLGIELRPATAMTFSIALGIAVDDTIHFLSRFRSEYIISKDHNQATTLTILTTGRAIIGTSITLGMGFLVLVFSNFKPNYEFGMLATIILIVALLSSLILLPSLINIIKPLGKSYE